MGTDIRWAPVRKRLVSVERLDDLQAERLVPDTVYEVRIGLSHLAHRFATGSRIRLELCCADSTITDGQFTHAYGPDMIGTDTIHHDMAHPSRLILPVMAGALP